MKHALALFLSLLTGAACAAGPVRVTLQASARVTANADGFWTLVQVATLTGGAKEAQTRLASVVVGRVPLPGETRTVTRGDVLLKLRQAGLRPGVDATVDGAGQLSVSAIQTAPLAPNNGGVRANPAPPLLGVGGPPSSTNLGPLGPLVHSGDPVAIVVQDGPLTITARGEARQAGSAGQSIRVHREGVMTDLRATVVDAQTVQLEM